MQYKAAETKIIEGIYKGLHAYAYIYIYIVKRFTMHQILFLENDRVIEDHTNPIHEKRTLRN